MSTMRAAIRRERKERAKTKQGNTADKELRRAAEKTGIEI